MFNASDPLYERSKLIFNDQQMHYFSEQHVLIAGVGGVGGFVAEALARAGIGRITLADHDTVSESNLNRQIIALRSTVGRNKVDVMKQRIIDINPACVVETLPSFLEADKMPSLMTKDFTFVVDAIDSLNCKVSLVASAVEASVPIVSSMGAGRRLDPNKIVLTDISKTHTCGLARNIRQRLKKLGIKKGVPVCFSTELPLPPGPEEEIEGARNRVVNGTASYMPGIFGLMIAGNVLQIMQNQAHMD